MLGKYFENKRCFATQTHVKTKWKVMSDFTGKKGTFPPCDPPPFLGKKFFFGFSEKFSKFFFNEIDCKKFSNCFYNEISSKKFFNSLKMTTKNFQFSIFFFNEIDCKKFSNFFFNEFSSKTFFNSLKLTIKKFRKFFTVNFIEKKNRKFFTANFIEKNFENF